MKTTLILFLFLSLQICLIAAAITRDEFNAAVTKSGYRAPSEQIYQHFADGTAKFSREEVAMFLSQLLHESAGFVYTEEIACKKTGCPERYIDKVGLPGKNYYGRGYIQLTWGSNYKAASQALGLDDQLLRHPEIVATDTKLAMQVSVWFWETRVRPRLGTSNEFGLTTKAINGGECTKYRERAERRWKIYVKVAEALKIANKAVENGCYTIDLSPCQCNSF